MAWCPFDDLTIVLDMEIHELGRTINLPSLFFNDILAMMGDPRRINQAQAYQAPFSVDQKQRWKNQQQ